MKRVTFHFGFSWTALLLILTGSLETGSALAQNRSPKPPPPPAFQNLADVDDDYHLQGEYRGWQRSQPSSRSSEPVGLQVIALGNGNFAATKYYGGLPGDGWYGGSRYEYQGQRFGDIVRFRNEQSIIEVGIDAAHIYSPEGRRAGELKKVLRQSPTLGALPPQNAIVLFDGEGENRFLNARITEDGLLQEGTQTVDSHGDFRLHLEYRLPYKPLGRGQDRGNSGLYIQGRYEVQILDSFGNEGIENECGSLYRLKRPDINMCYPPLAWQTYDVDFTMPRFSESGEKLSDMKITIWHNGILIHNNTAVPSKTGAGKPEAANPLPTLLQDHGNPVVYRNIWLIPKQDGEGVSADWVKLPLNAPPIPVAQWAPPLPIQLTTTGTLVLGSGCPSR